MGLYTFYGVYDHLKTLSPHKKHGITTIKKHIRINIKGLVQGVGFRPFIFRLAQQYNQLGWIANTGQGVTIELEGEPGRQQDFVSSLQHQAPPFSQIESITIDRLPLESFQSFELKSSITGESKSPFVLPDIAICSECSSDLFNPGSRYYRYPFTSCCHCGPRYSIMQSQPYDRERTSMDSFELCGSCKQEYQNPENRRFHAQTLACKDCGPNIFFLDRNGNRLAEQETALQSAVAALHAGKIIAVKGIGGYQLLVDARNQEALTNLRKRKNRPRKPFALMVPKLATAQHLCHITQQERLALTSAAAPIILLNRRKAVNIDDLVAPGNSLLGVILPYSPLHCLLLKDFGAPLVATSGNRENEPICIDQEQALHRLQDIADFFLSHNRGIVRPLDDSIVKIIGGKTTVLRRARGYAPTPVEIKYPIPETLAVGGYLKNTVAISRGKHVILSQHLGDLDTIASRQQFETTLADLMQFYQVKPSQAAHDLHPGYSSSQYAKSLTKRTFSVQHHFAHIVSCMAEHGIQPPVLGISWDGTGLGTDGELWGGEFLQITETGFERFAHLRTFPLPGGVKAIRQPRRAALGLLFELFGNDVFKRKNINSLQSFTAQELSILKTALDKKLNTPSTSSAGRLFDVAASLAGLCHSNRYEGEAAIRLESEARSYSSDKTYPFVIRCGSPKVLDWQQTIEAMLDDLSGDEKDLVPSKFHNTLAEMILAVAQMSKQSTMVISGGCFQNDCLVEQTHKRLHKAGFKVYQQESIPPNDGGLALGQLIASKYL